MVSACSILRARQRSSHPGPWDLGKNRFVRLAFLGLANGQAIPVPGILAGSFRLTRFAASSSGSTSETLHGMWGRAVLSPVSPQIDHYYTVELEAVRSAVLYMFRLYFQMYSNIIVGDEG